MAQAGALFLLLKLLSGKVRLSGLSTTGSDGEESRRGTNSGRRGKEGRAEGDWLELKRWGECAENRRTNKRWEATV